MKDNHLIEIPNGSLPGSIRKPDAEGLGSLLDYLRKEYVRPFIYGQVLDAQDLGNHHYNLIQVLGATNRVRLNQLGTRFDQLSAGPLEDFGGARRYLVEKLSHNPDDPETRRYLLHPGSSLLEGIFEFLRPIPIHLTLAQDDILDELVL